MAVIKCKMCGGDLNIIEGQSVCECEYCGTRQTVPVLDNEKKMNLFARANRLRFNAEFDKASGIYESIIADAPEEAEAYWGLVLCKYGIEYVDDPATGKKIPTCHRSSFDSVMQDSDFELACEYADPVARDLYQKEAGQIEEVRKGILEVSSKEDSYDIFICYKETDQQGDRTLDSVLAQDLYEALTDKGYRVFFARISLEDKLGQAYEPYIFAALNSAKIMLAVGTDYDYYNAVWVKNEWSRYLKLMVKDKDKHLIPCYKNMDAYDMPQEFSKLQSQDLSKVGAFQDLLRGIEKLLPKEKEKDSVPANPQRNDESLEILLKRGQISLNDQDWENAEGFFEKALNQNPECAEAYLGKALSAEKASDLQKLLEIRLHKTEKAAGEILAVPCNKTHIQEVKEKYSIPDYLPENAILNLYQFELRYYSYVKSRKLQSSQEQNYWQTNTNMTHALQFASAQLSSEIQRCLTQIYEQMDQRVQTAIQNEEKARGNIERNYSKFLQDADLKAENQYRNASAKKQEDQQAAMDRIASEKKKKSAKRAKRIVITAVILLIVIAFSVFKNMNNAKKLEQVRNSIVGETYSSDNTNVYTGDFKKRTVTFHSKDRAELKEGVYSLEKGQDGNYYSKEESILTEEDYEYELSISFWGKILLHINGTECRVGLDDDGSVSYIKLYGN